LKERRKENKLSDLLLLLVLVLVLVE